MLEGLEEWVVAMAATPWVFVALYLFATIDGFFPPIPSESVVIALAAASVAEGSPNFWVLGAVAAAGAFTGDQIAYSLGRRLPLHDMRMMQGRRQKRALAWADKALADRGAALIIAARYVPVGRVAVNMTAGAVGFSRARFTVLAAIAAVSWSIYSVALGIGAGVVLGENTLLAVVVGVAGGLALGFVIDPVIQWFIRRRLGRRERPAAGGDGRAEQPTGQLTGQLTGQPADGSDDVSADRTSVTVPGAS